MHYNSGFPLWASVVFLFIVSFLSLLPRGMSFGPIHSEHAVDSKDSLLRWWPLDMDGGCWLMLGSCWWVLHDFTKKKIRAVQAQSSWSLGFIGWCWWLLHAYFCIVCHLNVILIVTTCYYHNEKDKEDHHDASDSDDDPEFGLHLYHR